jgi:hypothetical protein
MNGAPALNLSNLEQPRQRTDNALKQAENIALRISVQSFGKRVIDDYGIEVLNVPACYSGLLIWGQPDPDEETAFVDSDFHEQVAVNSGEPTRSIWKQQGQSGFDFGTASMEEDEIERERSSYTEEKPTLPTQAVQGVPVKGELAEPATPIPRNEAQRLGVRLFQRGF